MIEIFTKYIPFKESQQMTYEYNLRMNDVNHFISGKYDFYAILKDDSETVQLLLAMSIFYKRVLTNFDFASKFTGRVIFKSDAKAIQLGTYELTKKEIFRIQSAIRNFKSLSSKFSIPETLYQYTDTKEFLRNVRNLKASLNNN